MEPLVRKALVIALCVVAACAYGVAHDQVTARLCVEYFTVAHPPLFHTTSITILALCWGITATVGIGALLGYVLALVSQAGEFPPFSLSRLLRPISVLLAIMAGAAFAAGLSGYWLSHAGFVAVPARFAFPIPATRHDSFMAVWFAHCASYIVGLFGAAVLCFRVWRVRGRPQVISFFPHTPSATLRAAVLGLITAYIVWARFGVY
jgi:hypothetical protein